MSEGEGSPAATATGREIWIEKYRPQSLADVHGQEEIVERLRTYIEQDDVPHLLFSGPAGVGKCVTGDAPVLTDAGIRPIEDVVGDTEGFDAPEDGVRVATLTDRNRFQYVEPSRVFGTQAEGLVELTTRDGSTFRVTPEHRFRVISHDGFEWVPAEDLSVDDRIARPSRLPSPSGDARIRWNDELNPEMTEVTLNAETAEHLGLDRTSSLSTIRSTTGTAEEWVDDVETIEYVRQGQRSRSITPPTDVTPELARFVGLAISEARIDGGRIKFYNTDDALLDAFESAAHDVFDVETRRGVRQDVPFVAIGSRTLTHYLESVFDVFSSASGGDGIGSTLVTADDDARAAFLRAMFDAEAHVGAGGTIELTRRNPDHITLLSYLLTTFGIPSRRKELRKSATNGSGIERTYHALYVSGARNLRRFDDAIGFSIAHKAERLTEHADKDANPNHDTIPTQTVLRELCRRFDVQLTEHLPESLDPESPGRERYCSVLDDVVDAAVERIEDTQRALARLEALRPELAATTTVPARWIDGREELAPMETRKAVSAVVGVRSDRLLEYSDGRRAPRARRAIAIQDELDRSDKNARVSHVKAELRRCIDLIGTDYAEIVDGLRFDTPDLTNLLRSDDAMLGSLTRLETVADRLRDIAADRLSVETIELLDDASRIAGADLLYDEIEAVERVETDERVYDLTVPGTRNYVAGEVPTVMHNTTAATAIAREIYGDDWRGNFLELNASDQRGIDVVRDRIKGFARSSFGGDFRIVFLDEADSLCVPPGTEVITGHPSKPEIKPIEEVSVDGEPIPSVDFETNEIRSDEGHLVDSGVADFFEMELDDGRTMLASPTHPFFVVGDDGQLVEKELRELSPGDEIADFGDEIGVSRCAVCDDWTAGRFCSLECKNEGHSREMRGEENPMYGVEWVVDADPDEVKADIGAASTEWWESLDDDEYTFVVGDGELPHHEHYEKDEFEAAALTDGGLKSVRTAEVSRIDYSHRGKAYNINMEGTPNFMLANGILTHNTDDAQAALRRTMEQFSDNTRFILSCNYSSKIIDPIQSRCAVFRFSPLSDEAVAAQTREIAAAEGIEVTEAGVDALVYAADGDMRRAINSLQAAATTGDVVDEEAVYAITATARPEEIESMVTDALEGDFTKARATLDTLLTDTGMAGGDVIDQLHRSVWAFDLHEREAVRLMERVGEADYRIAEGANEQVQLEALLAALALRDEE